MYGLPNMRNLGKAPSLLPPAAYASFLLERAPLPLRTCRPLGADGLAAQFSTAPRPSGIECHFGPGDLAIAMAFSRLELVIRGGYASDLAHSYMASFMKSPRLVPGSAPGLVALECQMVGSRGPLRGDGLRRLGTSQLTLGGQRPSMSTIL